MEDHSFYDCNVCQNIYMACLGWRIPLCHLCGRRHWHFERCADVIDRPIARWDQ